MNSGERPSASSTSRLASRAAALFSGSCRLLLASADWWPEVALPSTQSAASMIARMRPTPPLPSRSGMASIIASAFASEAVEQAQHRRAVLARRRPAASDGAGRPADIVADAGEIALVGDVLDVELRRHAVPERVGQEGAVDEVVVGEILRPLQQAALMGREATLIGEAIADLEAEGVPIDGEQEIGREA